MTENEFPLKFFPERLQHIILETCHVYQFNPDFLAASILSTAATAFGNTFAISVKNGWIERPSLWISIVALPGVNKSAPVSWAMRPIDKREKELYKVYKQQIDQFLKNQDTKADKTPPPLIKTVISDATPEAVVQQLHKNDRGVMIYYDELAGFMDTFQRYNKGNDEQFYLQVWSGKTVIVDRKSSPSIRVDNPVLNIIGTIQPAVFDRVFKGKEESGFFDRWLIVNPRHTQKSPWSDEELREEIEKDYQKIIDRLQDLNFKINSYGDQESVNLVYSHDSWALLKRWQRKNTDFINSTEIDSTRAIRSKMEIYVHRFALVAHMLDYATTDSHYVPHEVQVDATGRAILLADYFINKAMYTRSVNPEDKLQDKWKELYDILPDNQQTFTYSEFMDRCTFLDISASSARRWLEKNNGKLINKIKHATYFKI